jgi:hypothetical protein
MLSSCLKKLLDFTNWHTVSHTTKLASLKFRAKFQDDEAAENLASLVINSSHQKSAKFSGCLAVMGALANPAAHADSVLGVELSPAICKLNPYMGNLRQCIEGNPMTVNFYRVANQSCSNSRYSMSPLQENLTSKVIPDGNIRKNIWQQYGRCSGLSTSNYFRTITSLASQLKLPKELSSGRSYRFASSGLSRQLLSLNPGMKPNSFNFFCQKNSAGQSVLTYINVCYDNNGRFAQCATRSYTCPSQFLIDGNY